METGGSHYVFLGSAIPDWTGIGHDVSLYDTAFYYTGSGPAGEPCFRMILRITQTGKRR